MYIHTMSCIYTCICIYIYIYIYKHTCFRAIQHLVPVPRFVLLHSMYRYCLPKSF